MLPPTALAAAMHVLPLANPLIQPEATVVVLGDPVFKTATPLMHWIPVV